MDVTVDKTGTLRAAEHGHQPIVLENHPADSRVKICEDGIVQTLSSRMGTGGGNTPMVMQGVDVYNGDISGEKAVTLTGASGGTNTSRPKVMEETEKRWIVRRLTPMECERLQGYPDHWTDIGDWIDDKGKKHKGDSDAPRYKALGNSIALPFWEWMAQRMAQFIESEDPTMASLFDGIGGFPLAFQKAGVRPVWASEIEEFPIQVTKRRLR